jgi:CDP-diglyceride synthetase
MNERVKKTLLGFLIGIAGLVLGFVFYGSFFSWMNGVDFNYFYNQVFLGTELFRSQIITGSLLVNVLFFFILMKRREDEMNRGLLITILLAVIAIVFYFA